MFSFRSGWNSNRLYTHSVQAEFGIWRCSPSTAVVLHSSNLKKKKYCTVLYDLAWCFLSSQSLLRPNIISLVVAKHDFRFSVQKENDLAIMPLLEINCHWCSLRASKQRISVGGWFLIQIKRLLEIKIPKARSKDLDDWGIPWAEGRGPFAGVSPSNSMSEWLHCTSTPTQGVTDAMGPLD
jgi:hypothetical protein